MIRFQVPQCDPYEKRCLSPEPSFTYPSGSPVKEPPPVSPHRARIERDAPFPETSFICLWKSLVNEPTPGSPARTLWREMPDSRAFLYTSFRSPSKGAPLPVSPIRAPIEPDAPFPEPSFNSLSKFPVNGNLPPPCFPTGPLWKKIPVSRALF